MPLISPKTPPGIMELLPRDQIAFQRMLDTIRSGFERFGFVPIETPVFETVQVLLTKSGGETEKQVYFVQSTGGRQQGKEPDLALRFDLTVPLARYVAEHERDLPFPFRRYQIQRVYRGERAQKGRFREFYQCDIDVVGKDSLPIAYDAEMPAVIHHVFSLLDVGAFRINFNNRKLLLGLLEHLGITAPDVLVLVLREIDRLDKAGSEKVQAALTADPINLPSDTAGRILETIAAQADNASLLAMLRDMGIDTPAFREGLAEVEAVLEMLPAFGVPADAVRLNLAIARGLDYYTGTVYETFLLDHPSIGSVCSGGRYDSLAGHYTRSRLPGVGLSIGATRLFYALQAAGAIGPAASTAAVLVVQIDEALLPETFRLAADLRAQAINTAVQPEVAKLDKQLKYADKAGIPLAVLLGPDELRRGTAMLKDLRSGDQREVTRADLADAIRAALR